MATTLLLYPYPGDGHLFSDSSLPGYVPVATEAMLTRVLTFLDRVEA